MTESDGEERIRLDSFLKAAQIVSSGGEAKHLIQGGGVFVNGELEVRRSRKLRHGDVVGVDDAEYTVEFG